VSRHRLPTKSPRFEVFVKGKEEDQPFIWLGADGPTTWKTIIDAVSPYAAVSLEIAERLVEDRRLNRA
jgi:hypothetical protein